MSCDSIDKLKMKLGQLEKELADHIKFKDFYQFTFNYAKEPNAKSLELETAIIYWGIVLKGRFKFLELWNTFLQVSFLNMSIYFLRQFYFDSRYKEICANDSQVSLHFFVFILLLVSNETLTAWIILPISSSTRSIWRFFYAVFIKKICATFHHKFFMIEYDCISFACLSWIFCSYTFQGKSVWPKIWSRT